ncbi:gas vesicle protein GvpM [Halopiger djelfimassiliensis]|uniref:gas vesicle protein GvpM n=1 Tax=Halopiger djelfimassiliensis TaxID=1293047 RepID=UPI00067769D5|nr:gas vesicle protein [Halopiger djelfimassiliensis]
MRPRKDDEALVDVLDVLLRDGVIVRADVIVSVAEIPLVGIKLTAAIAGMETMTEYGLFEEWDARHRTRAVERRQYDTPDDPERLAIGHRDGRSVAADDRSEPETENRE